MALYPNPRYQLAHHTKKQICPRNCEGPRRVPTWRLYYDTTTGETLPPEFGICDNLHKCGHHMTPAAGGLYENMPQPRRETPPPPMPPAPTIDLPELLISQCRTNWQQSRFARNLTEAPGGKFGCDTRTLAPIAHLYELGAITEGPSMGAVVFIFRNHKKAPRYAQVKKFNAENHGLSIGALHTDPSIRELARQANRGNPWGAVVAEWLPLYENQPTKQDCLFGAHLLEQYPKAVVCVVEAPKTAIYATIALGRPEDSGLLFVATGGASMLNRQRCEPLRGRDLLLYPDADQYTAWRDRGNQLATELDCRLTLSDISTQYADTLGPTNDLADILELEYARAHSGKK